MIVNVKRLYPDATLPTRGSEEAAGYDLHAWMLPHVEGYTIPPHTTVKIPTGIAIQGPKGYFGAIFARSGLATKQGLRPANCVGVVDSDYRGEILVALHNDSSQPRRIQRGERIAQLVMLPYLPVEFHEVDNLESTARGEGGFGSTGA